MKYKFKLWTYTPIDVKTAEAELNSMARRGYVFRGIGGLNRNVAVYERNHTSGRDYYAIDYSKDKSKEERDERKAFYQETGWDLVYDGYDYLCIYVTNKANSTGLYSDIDTRLEGIERAVTLGTTTSKAFRRSLATILSAIIFIFSRVMLEEQMNTGTPYFVACWLCLITGVFTGDLYQIRRLKEIKNEQKSLNSALSKATSILNKLSRLALIGAMLCFFLMAISIAINGEHTTIGQIASYLSVVLLGSIPVIGLIEILSLCSQRMRESGKWRQTFRILEIGAISLGGTMIIFCIF